MYRNFNLIKTNDTVISNPDDISVHIVNHFQTLFNNNSHISDNGLIDEVIPHLITDRINNLLTNIPSENEIFQAVFSLNKDSAPGPDGFGALFFQTYWDIIKYDVTKAVLQFFTTGWILPSFNSNNIVLIPKTNHADTMNDYRPIAIANFKFKIISKILADRLSTFMPAITSVQQRGFIKGRSIKDCICLTSEAINTLHNKSFGGNLALKVDIAKAFDTLDWSFLLKVLKKFGFSETFCKWIHSILMSAKLSVSINGKMHGYFSCSRGVRQGDPLSPLLFCLAEEVISRCLTKQVMAGKLKLIQGTRDIPIPSHILYADDMMIFCKGTLSNINCLKQIFFNYAEVSGQLVNPQKSSIFSESISNRRLSQIASSLGFKIGSLPFTYLGVPIFRGKPKKSYFQPIADKFKLKLASWKASLLSMAGRVQLVKSVAQSMLIHCLSIYSWPVSLIKDLERCMRNFIWSGDINQKKLVTVSWHKVCTPTKEGGLGIRNLSFINEAGNLRLCWEILQSDLQWAAFLRSRVMRNNTPISHHISSSIWCSAKHKFPTILNNSTWQIGNGENINFWCDSWCGQPLISTYNIPAHLHSSLSSSVSSYIHNSRWNVPLEIHLAYPSLQQKLSFITIPLTLKEDRLVWKHSHDGNLSFKDAYLFQSNTAVSPPAWCKYIWNIAIPPSKSLLLWRILQDKLPTDDQLIKRGCQIPSVCNLCALASETYAHLFLDCSFATQIWNWFRSILNNNFSVSSFADLFKVYELSWSPQCKLVILSAIINCLNTIWWCRNQRRFNDKIISINTATNLIISSTSLSGNITSLTARSSISEFVIMKHFRVNLKPPKPQSIKEVIWSPPVLNWVKCNTDGASIGNPGISACGGLFRNANSEFLGAFAINIGLSSALLAELIGAMVAIEVAYHKGWHSIWLETDSMLVFQAFKSSKIIPWSLKNRWDNCLHLLSSMNFFVTHIYREGNKCADILANVGLSIASYSWFSQAPPEINLDFVKNKLGFPNFRVS